MKIHQLELLGFRSYQKQQYTFPSLTTVLVGPNASGKTNVLEAIYLLATGDSFRADKIEEMVSWESEVAHVVGRTDQDELMVTLTRGLVQGKRVAKRGFKVNGVGRRKQDFAGNLKAVVFLPEDLDLMSGSPGLRRRFLDEALIQVDSEYRRSLANYEQALRRRNRILDDIAEGKTSRTALAFWDSMLIKHGQYLTVRRRDLVEFMNGVGGQAVADLAVRVEYDPSTISEKRLAQYSREEVAAGYTLVGPHRDDFSLMSQGRDLSIYGSRGEQRMGVLWLKLNQLAFVTAESGESPLLLLDDIFSELDENHDRAVVSLLGRQQTIITTTQAPTQLQKLPDLMTILVKV